MKDSFRLKESLVIYIYMNGENALNNAITVKRSPTIRLTNALKHRYVVNVQKRGTTIVPAWR
jgi:predicted nucleic acid-binding protein